MTELTPDQQRDLDATVAAVQRVAMHIVTLPKKQYWNWRVRCAGRCQHGGVRSSGNGSSPLPSR